MAMSSCDPYAIAAVLAGDDGADMSPFPDESIDPEELTVEEAVRRSCPMIR